MVIRPAVPDEAAVLSKLAVRSKANWGYTAQFMDACRSELTYEPRQIEDECWLFMVAEEVDGIVGFYALERVSDEESELTALFVEPHWIGRGIGRVLMNHATALAASHGSSVLMIQSDPYAANFYRSMGARPTGLRESGSIPRRYLPTFAIYVGVSEPAKGDEGATGQ